MPTKKVKLENNEYVNSASKMPPVKNNKIFRSIRFKADVKTLVVRTEIGYDLVYELNPQIRVNPYESSEKGSPEFQSSIVWTLKGARPRGNAMKQPEIEALVKDRSLLPMDMDWDMAQLGFVYSNARDPNNHRWWLEALKAGQKMGEYTSLLSEYTLDLSSTAPIGTRSWFDGIHHGRFTIQKDYIEGVYEDTPGHIKIKGNGKGKIGDIKPNVKIPDTAKFARLTFDIRKNVWYIDLIDKGGKNMTERLTTANFKSDANYKAHMIPNPNRPKVSGIINAEDISGILHNDTMTLIKGKA